jgi:hypothetical protein
VTAEKRRQSRIISLGNLSDYKDNRSFNESNSTSQRGDGQGPPGNGVVAKQVRPESVGNEPDPFAFFYLFFK